MKTITFLIMLIFAAYSLQAHNKTVNADDSTKKRKMALIISIGSARPLGDLASQDVSRDEAGLALKGIDAKLTFTYKLHENYGLIAISNSEQFRLNTQGMANYLAAQYPGIKVKVSSLEGWSLNNILVGGYGAYPITKSKKLFAEGRILFGLSTSSSPDYTIIMSGYNKAGQYEAINAHQYSGPAYNMSGSLLAGAGLKYNFGKKMTAVFNMDYLIAGNDQYYDDILIRYDTGYTETTSFSMAYQSFSVTAGIGWRFGK